MTIHCNNTCRGVLNYFAIPNLVDKTTLYTHERDFNTVYEIFWQNYKVNPLQAQTISINHGYMYMYVWVHGVHNYTPQETLYKRVSLDYQ